MVEKTVPRQLSLFPAEGMVRMGNTEIVLNNENFKLAEILTWSRSDGFPRSKFHLNKTEGDMPGATFCHYYGVMQLKYDQNK